MGEVQGQLHEVVTVHEKHTLTALKLFSERDTDFVDQITESDHE